MGVSQVLRGRRSRTWWISCRTIAWGICVLLVCFLAYLLSSCAGDADIDTAWMVAWNSGRLDISNIFVTINSVAQLYYITAKLEPMNTKSLSSVLTHVVSKTFAGIGVLDLLHNTSAAFFKGQDPSMAVKVLTGVGFGAASAFSDWIFGGCLVYDLVALAVGQSGSWRNLLGVYALGSAGIVTARNLARSDLPKKVQ